jgi:CheY-like chemotaxis protein
VIEDNPPDVLLVEEALSEHKLQVEVETFRDGEQAIGFVKMLDSDETAPCPVLFLVDLNIPTCNGEEVLAEIRRSRRCARTPVVIITSSNFLRDRQNTERLGANHYFCKPTNLDDFMKLGEIVQKLLTT